MEANNGKTLQDEIDRLSQAIREQFPHVEFDPTQRVGAAYEWTDPEGNVHLICNDNCGDAEAFFRGRDPRELSGRTSAETAELEKVFFAARHPVRRWTSMVGEPLVAWTADEYSYLHLSPQARAYYFPAYLLTCLQLMRPTVVAGPPRDDKAVPVLLIIISDILEPPEGFDIWAALADPRARDKLADRYLDTLSKRDFLEFISALTPEQRRAIREFLDFAINKYLTHMSHILRDPGIVIVRKCWLESMPKE